MKRQRVSDRQFGFVGAARYLTHKKGKTNMTKTKRFVAMTLLIVTLIGAGSALAANHDFDFVFTNVTTTSTTQSYAKSDSDQKWYISLDTMNPDGYSNTMSSSNIFGARARKASNGATASNYHTFSNYVTGYGMNYTATGITQGTSIYIAAKKDDASSSSSALYISGRFAP
jgi:hypothetical protein